MRKLLVIGVAGLAAACSAGAQTSGGGAQGQRSFEVGAFQSVSLEGSHDVVVTVGGAPSVRAEGSQEVLDRLDIRVENGALRIGTERGNWYWFGRSGHVTVYVTAPALQAASIGGSGRHAHRPGREPALRRLDRRLGRHADRRAAAPARPVSRLPARAASAPRARPRRPKSRSPARATSRWANCRRGARASRSWARATSRCRRAKRSKARSWARATSMSAAARAAPSRRWGPATSIAAPEQRRASPLTVKQLRSWSGSMIRTLPALLAVALLAAPALAAERRYSVTDFERIEVDGPYVVRLTTGRASVGDGERAAGRDRPALGRGLRPDSSHPPRPHQLERQCLGRPAGHGRDRRHHPPPALGAADRAGAARHRPHRGPARRSRRRGQRRTARAGRRHRQSLPAPARLRPDRGRRADADAQRRFRRRGQCRGGRPGRRRM